MKPRVFIGSGEASVLERKTLVHSLRKACGEDLDVYVYNGTHNTVEHNDEEPRLTSMPLSAKYRNVTEFSLYRFLIPEICEFQGRAIWLDSDMLCFQPIRELFDAALGENHFLAKGEAYSGEGGWGLSVMLIDCGRSRFDMQKIADEMDRGLYTYEEALRMAPSFLSCYPYRIGEIDPRWNVFDDHEPDTRLIHYTNLYTQPWKFAGHPYEDLWFEAFNQARDAGVITERDIDLALMRAYVRRDIREAAERHRKTGKAAEMTAGKTAPRSLLSRLKERMTA
jgi:hypothetical protein